MRKKQLALMAVSMALLSGCTKETAGAASPQSASEAETGGPQLSWERKPGSLEIDDFQNIAIILPNSGYGSYSQAAGYGPQWVEVNARDLVKGDRYTGDAIIGMKNGRKKIYDFAGKTGNTASFSEFNYDSVLGAYVYDEDLNSDTVHYFDQNFGMHTTKVEGIGGDLSGDEAVYADGMVYSNGNGPEPAASFAAEVPAILPVKKQFSLAQEQALYEDDTFSMDPDGYVIVQKGKDPLFLPEGMTPAYAPEVSAKGLYEPKSERYNTSFVNGVVKLLDAEGKMHLWNIASQSYVSPEAFDDAGYFEDGIIGVQKDGHWAFMDASGRLLTDYLFAKVSAVYKGRAYVKYQGQTGILNVKETAGD